MVFVRFEMAIVLIKGIGNELNALLSQFDDFFVRGSSRKKNLK